ncbi:MAG: thiamine diphosphokinase [Bacteroidales bacterium]|nr:thiamine diphosphokinase [Bacteroidales bacterium]
MRVTLVANGEFPTHPLPLNSLRRADKIVCCDAAIVTLLDTGFQPAENQTIDVVGDCDSLPQNLRAALPYPLHPESEQDDNDLTKAFRWTLANTSEPLCIDIVGATGLREDHTMGNLSLLMRYHLQLDEKRPGSQIQMLTNHGTFTAVNGSATFTSFARQQVSIFSLSPDVPVSATGLQYSLENRCLTEWWEATLNSALGNTFSLQGGKLLVFQTYEAKE